MEDRFARMMEDRPRAGREKARDEGGLNCEKKPNRRKAERPGGEEVDTNFRNDVLYRL